MKLTLSNQEVQQIVNDYIAKVHNVEVTDSEFDLGDVNTVPIVYSAVVKPKSNTLTRESK